MPTLAELKAQFEKTASAPPAAAAVAPNQRAAGGGQTKTASEEDPMPSKSLQDLFLEMTALDKTAAVAAGVDDQGGQGAQGEQEGDDFAKVAAAVAEAEAAELAGGGTAEGQQGSAQGNEDIMKIAADYDAGGRIMARGFMDEFLKLAAAATAAAPNQMTESPSAAKTPALGNRGLVTVKTNFAGSPNHDQKMESKGGKENYANSLKPAKTVAPGVTGDNPEAAAISTGSGSPQGFATVRSLKA